MAWSSRPTVSTRMCRFLPLIFLPASYPCGSMHAPFFCAFHALAVDDGGGRAGFPLRAFATPFIERVVDSLQCAVIGPQIEVIVDRAFRWQILRDRAPLTASRENVHEAVHHLPHDHRPLATAGLARRDQRFDQSPFLVGQIARISQLAAVVTGAVLARPHQWPLLESGHYSSITGDSYDSSTLRTDTKSELRSSRPREERGEGEVIDRHRLNLISSCTSHPLAAEAAELKLLQRSPGRGVVMPPCVDQAKPVAELCTETVRIIAADRQAATSFRAVGRKCRDDGMSADAQGAAQSGHVSRLVVRLGEKVKRRPVVPHIESSRGLPNGHVDRKPCHPVCLVADAGSGRSKRGSRQIEHGHVLITSRNKIIHE